MGLGSECSFNESVEDNGSITNFSAFKMLEDHDGSKNNGFCPVEDDRFPVIQAKGSDILGSVAKHEVSPTPSMINKGVGLKKWKRITRVANKNGNGNVDSGKMVKHCLSSPDAKTGKRFANKNGNGNVDSGKMVKHCLSSPDAKTGKRLQGRVRAKQESEGSVSSTDAVVRSLDGFALLDDSGLVIEPAFAAGTDSENSEDHSSKSSTAASARKSRYLTSGIVGFPQHRCSLGSSSGRNLMRSMQHGPKVKNQVETVKKARGEQVKIDKENSHSSIESNSRSSNVLFIHGAYPTRNGKPSEGPGASDGENGDKFYGRGRVFNDELPFGTEGDCEVRYNGKTIDGVVAVSSRGCKEDGSENHDPLVESIFALQLVQEALEKELLKFRDIIHDASNDDSIRNLLPEFEDVSQKLQQATLEGSQHDEDELEYLFKQKIEAEVEYLVFSRMGQSLRVDVMDQNLILGHHKAVANEQSQMLEKLQGTQNKAKMIKKEAEKLENCCKDNASPNDTLTLQCGIFKYTLCFFMQLVLLVIIIGVFMLQLSQYYVYDVPT